MPQIFEFLCPGPSTDPVIWVAPGSASLPAYCLYLRILFPPRLSLGLGGPGGEGGELSGASTPSVPQWTRPAPSQGWALAAPGRRVPLPSATHTRLLVGGTPKPFWEGLQRNIQPRLAAPPPLPPGHLEKHSLTAGSEPALCLLPHPPLPLALSMFLWLLVFFPDWGFLRGPPGE